MNPPGLLLSTMYLQRFADRDLPALADLALELGFVGLELGPVVDEQALERLEPGHVPVPAVHHPCPAHAGRPPSWAVMPESAHDEQRILRAFGRTLATAVRYGARRIVVHLGAVTGPPGQEARRLAFELASRCAAGQYESPRHRELLAALDAEMSCLEQERSERIVAMLSKLGLRARREGAQLAVETAYHPHELPRPRAMRNLLDALSGEPVGAWLDTGHVAAQSHLGVASQACWIDAVGSRWLGAHLHDAVGLRDHLVAGIGTVDFAPALAALPPDAVLTCEFDWYFSPREVRDGRERIERMMA